MPAHHHSLQVRSPLKIEIKTNKYIYTTFREIKPLYQCLIKQSLRKPTILMINFINMVGFNYSVSLLCWHFISQRICNLSLCGMYRQPL